MLKLLFFSILCLNYLKIKCDLCPEGYFYCGGSKCWNMKFYDSCCNELGINKKEWTCCKDTYNMEFKCQANQTCCGNYCVNQDEQCCDSYKCLNSQTCCKSRLYNNCCEPGRECCDGKCCEEYYSCSVYNGCQFTFNYFLLPIPSFFSIFGLIFISNFIKEKYFNSKLKKVEILNQNNYHYRDGFHSAGLTVEEVNPERILEELGWCSTDLSSFKTKKEFENSILGVVNKQFRLSSTFSFISINLCLYFAILIRLNFLILFFLISLNFIILLNLYVVVYGKAFFKSTRLHFSASILQFLTFLIFFLPLGRNFQNLNDSVPLFILFMITCIISVYIPCSIIKFEVSGNLLCVTIKTAVGGSRKDSLGNTHTSSSLSITHFKIPYPPHLLTQES
jgi:hypothetical protein